MSIQLISFQFPKRLPNNFILRICNSSMNQCFKYNKIRKGSCLNSDHTAETQTNLRKQSRKCSDTFSESSSKYKTEICQYWRNGRVCPFKQGCYFAHGQYQLRAKEISSSKYKTKPCVNFSKNFACPYGSRCQFLHNYTESQLDNPTKIITNHYWFPYDCSFSCMNSFRQLNYSQFVNSSNLFKILSYPCPSSMNFEKQKNSSYEQIYPEEQIMKIYELSSFNDRTKPRLYSL